MTKQLIDNPETLAGGVLNKLVSAYSELDDAWNSVQKLRHDLAATMAATGETSEVQRYVSLKRKKGTIDSPKLAELRLAYELEAERVLADNAEAIHEAQLAYQAADEALYEAGTSELMRQLAGAILLEQSRLVANGEYQSSIVLKRRKVREQLTDGES